AARRPLGSVPVRRVPADRPLRGDGPLAGDEDPGALLEEGPADAGRGVREGLEEDGGRGGVTTQVVTAGGTWYVRPPRPGSNMPHERLNYFTSSDVGACNDPRQRQETHSGGAGLSLSS